METIIGIISLVFGIALVVGFIREIIGSDSSGSSSSRSSSSSSSSGSSSYRYSSKKDCHNCRYFLKDVDLPYPVCTYHKFHFENDYDATNCDEYYEK